MQALKFIRIALLLLPVSYAQAQSGESASARKSKIIQVGVHGGIINGTGSNLGLFLPGDNRIDLSYSMSSLDFFGLTYKQSIYSLEFQSFLGNSFYYALGVTQRNLDITINDYFNEDTGGITTHLTCKGQSVGPHLVIGNEWQWDHFYLGAEWVGFINATTWEYSNKYNDDTWTESDKAFWDKTIERAVKQTTFMGLNLTMGFSF